MSKEEKESWTIADARELYSIERWGLRYFDINEKGQVTVAPLDTIVELCRDRRWHLRHV